MPYSITYGSMAIRITLLSSKQPNRGKRSLSSSPDRTKAPTLSLLAAMCRTTDWLKVKIQVCHCLGGIAADPSAYIGDSCDPKQRIAKALGQSGRSCQCRRKARKCRRSLGKAMPARQLCSWHPTNLIHLPPMRPCLQIGYLGDSQDVKALGLSSRPSTTLHGDAAEQRHPAQRDTISLRSCTATGVLERLTEASNLSEPALRPPARSAAGMQSKSKRAEPTLTRRFVPRAARGTPQKPTAAPRPASASTAQLTAVPWRGPAMQRRGSKQGARQSNTGTASATASSVARATSAGSCNLTQGIADASLRFKPNPQAGPKPAFVPKPPRTSAARLCRGLEEQTRSSPAGDRGDLGLSTLRTVSCDAATLRRTAQSTAMAPKPPRTSSTQASGPEERFL